MSLIEFIAFIFFMLLFMILSFKTRAEKRRAHQDESFSHQNLADQEAAEESVDLNSSLSEESDEEDWGEDYYEKNRLDCYPWDFVTEEGAEESPYSSNFTETGMTLEMQEEELPYAFYQPREPRVKKYFNRVKSYQDLVIYFEIYSAPKALRNDWHSFDSL